LSADPRDALSYRMTMNGADVIEPSAAGIVVDGRRLGERSTIGRADPYTVDERYPWIGVHSTAQNHCRGARVALTDAGPIARWTIDLRACDDGAAFRYVVP